MSQNSLTIISSLNSLTKEMFTTMDSLSLTCQAIMDCLVELKVDLKTSLASSIGTDEKEKQNSEKLGTTSTSQPTTQVNNSEITTMRLLKDPYERPQLWRNGIDSSKLIKKGNSSSKKKAKKRGSSSSTSPSSSDSD